MVLAQKLSPQSILFAAVIIFLGLPVKVFKIIKFLIQHNSNLNESLVYFYFLNYETIKDKKIEIIFKKTYLNPSTREDIIMKIIKYNSSKPLEEITRIYFNLVAANNRYMNLNNRFSLNRAPFKLGLLETEEGLKIKVPH